jgi:hypothetical protein
VERENSLLSLAGGRYSEQVPTARNREKDDLRSKCLGQYPGYADVDPAVWKIEGKSYERKESAQDTGTP